MKEIWKDIPNYEGSYQVSNTGRVKSLERKVKRGNHYMLMKSKLFNLVVDNIGYYTVTLMKDNKRKYIRIHTLVAITFLGHKQSGRRGLVVDHIDTNKLNNNLDNLQIITIRENVNKNRVRGVSQYWGVTYQKGAWQARLKINREDCYLGRFKTELAAHLACEKLRDEKAKDNL